MNAPAEGSLFAPGGRPVALPGEARPTRGRKVGASIAIATLVVGVAIGIVYHEFWKTVSHDVSRLLPASTQVYAAVTRPDLALAEALKLDRWRSPAEMQARVRTRGLLAPPLSRRVAGVQLQTLTDLFQSADAVRLAVVPSAGDRAMSVFVELSDGPVRRRMRSRLAADLESIDRRLGFDVQALRERSGLLPWAEPVLPLRMVSMDPHLVFTLGPEPALHELLQAKVAGTSQPLHGKTGFDAVAPEQRDGTELAVYVDAGVVYDALSPEPAGDAAQAAELTRAMLIDSVRFLGARASIRGPDDVLEITAQVATDKSWPELGDLLGSGRHALLAQVPRDADAAVSVTVEDPRRATETMAALRRQIAKQLDDPIWLQELSYQLRELQSQADLQLTDDLLGALAGELAVVWLARDPATLDAPRWVAIARLRDPQAVEEATQGLIRFAVRRGQAHGIIQRASDTLHVLRPARPGTLSSGLPETLAWRFRGRWLEIAPRVALLDQLAGAQRSGDTLGALDLDRRALRSLPPRSAAVAIAHPRLLGRSLGAAGATLGRWLSDDFRLAAALTFSGRDARLVSNVGLWSAAAVLAAASRSELDRVLLADVAPACLDAFEALCDAAPDALPCAPWQPRRGALITEACKKAAALSRER